jgi:hypothetical protein
MDAFRDLLASFGASLGLPELAPDDEGYCALRFDDLEVHLQYEPEEDELLVFTRLGEIDDDEPAELYGRMLAANLFWQGTGGATLGVQPEDGMVFLSRKVAMRALDDAKFRQLLEQFVNTGDDWRREVESFVSDQVTEQAKASALPDAPAGGGPGIIEV